MTSWIHQSAFGPLADSAATLQVLDADGTVVCDAEVADGIDAVRY